MLFSKVLFLATTFPKIETNSIFLLNLHQNFDKYDNAIFLQTFSKFSKILRRPWGSALRTPYEPGHHPKCPNHPCNAMPMRRPSICRCVLFLARTMFCNSLCINALQFFVCLKYIVLERSFVKVFRVLSFLGALLLIWLTPMIVFSTGMTISCIYLKNFILNRYFSNSNIAFISGCKNFICLWH